MNLSTMYITYWIVNFFRYLMTAGTFCSIPIGIPVTVSTMKNLVVNSFLSFVLSLFCSLKDGVILEGFFQCGHILKQMFEITSLQLSNFLNLTPLDDCNLFFHSWLWGTFYIIYKLESVCQSQLFHVPKSQISYIQEVKSWGYCSGIPCSVRPKPRSSLGIGIGA